MLYPVHIIIRENLAEIFLEATQALYPLRKTWLKFSNQKNMEKLKNEKDVSAK